MSEPICVEYVGLFGLPWLLAHGANPNDLGHWGDSALHSAVKHGSNDRVIKLLLAHGADPKRKNKDGKSAIALAKELRHGRILGLLNQKHTKEKP